METLTTFRQGNPGLLRTLGIAAVAAVAGGVSGIVLSKAMLATKGAALAQSALAAKGAGAASAGMSSLPAWVPQSSATLTQAAHFLRPVAGGTSLSDKAIMLWNALSRNALPLGTGTAGGVGATALLMKQRVRSLQDALSEKTTQTEAAQTEEARLQSELAGAEAHLRDLQSKLEALSTPRPSPPDSLIAIQGIGRVFAQRLNAAGIYTFIELAAQTPEVVRDIVGTTRVDTEAWIAEAKQLADPGPL